MNIAFYNRHWFDPAAVAIWSERATLARWIEVEVALAEVQARLGVIPRSAAEGIAQGGDPQAFDLDALAEAVRIAQHPFVPFLKIFEDLCPDGSGGWLHWGATTQNIFDTTQALQLKATVELVLERLGSITDRLALEAARHAGTVQAGRTHGQHALPISWGYKLAGWLDEMRRHADRLERLLSHAFVARTGGGTGTYAGMNGRGREVEAALSERLGLATPQLGGRGDFDRQAEVVAALGMLTAGCERIADNLIFLQRTEVAEVHEDHHAGRVGSSTMAQKRNPAEAQKTAALARLARSRVSLALDCMVRDDEGDAVSTNVSDYFLPEFGVLVASCVTALDGLLGQIAIDADAMHRNALITGGMMQTEAVMMELARTRGRGEAHHLLREAANEAHRDGVSFVKVLESRLELADLDVKALLAPENYLGEVEGVIASLVEVGRPGNGNQAAHG